MAARSPVRSLPPESLITMRSKPGAKRLPTAANHGLLPSFFTDSTYQGMRELYDALRAAVVAVEVAVRVLDQDHVRAGEARAAPPLRLVQAAPTGQPVRLAAGK